MLASNLENWIFVLVLKGSSPHRFCVRDLSYNFANIVFGSFFYLYESVILVRYEMD
jgi:hypothetical protein